MKKKESKVQLIRKAYLKGERNPHKIKKKFGVSINTVKTQFYHAKKILVTKKIKEGIVNPTTLMAQCGASRNMVEKLISSKMDIVKTTNKKKCKRCGIIISKRSKKTLCKICKPFGEISTHPIIVRNPCTIGADPEFLFVNCTEGDVLSGNVPNGSVTSANTILRGGLSGKVGCDGCSSTAEIRPSPSKDAVKLSKNIKKCLEQVNNKLWETKRTDLQMLCGSGTPHIPIGGHIHFGGIYLNHLDPTNMPPTNPVSTLKLVHALDMVSCLLASKQSLIRNRRLRHYGRLGDARRQPWGFEYRVPESWLTDPKTATAILALYHSVVIEWQNLGMLSEGMRGLVELWENIPNISAKYMNNKGIFKYKKLIIQYLTSLNTIRCGIFNYREIILDYIDTDLKEKEKRQVLFINKQLWKLKDITPTQNVLKFNYDSFLDIISTMVENIECKIKCPVMVIGTQDGREFDIVCSPKMSPKTIKLLRDYSNKYELRFTLSNDYERFGQKLVGFSLNLRTQRRGDIVRLLNKIAKYEKPSKEEIKCAE